MFSLKSSRSRLVLCIATAAFVVFSAGISGAEESVAAVLDKPADMAKIEPGQTPAVQPPQPDRITGEYVKGCFADTGRMLASPTTWDGDDWLKAALVVGATSGLYFADGDIRNLAQRNQSQAGHDVAAIGNVLGNPLYVAPPLGLLYLYGHLNQDPKARRASLLAVESLAISGAFTFTVKLATQRPRPFTGEAPSNWGGPGHTTGDPSFPSIHAQTAFSIATVIAEEYGNNPLVPPIAYGLATFVGLSRVYDNKHWASDVFFGAAVGYIVGKTVVGYHTLQSDTALKILPTVSQQGFGMMAEYRF